MSKISDIAFIASSDMRNIQLLLKKLQQPLTSPNWENEAKLLTRQLERAIKSLNELKRALGAPPQ